MRHNIYMGIRKKILLVTCVIFSLATSNYSLAKDMLYTQLQNKDLDQMRLLIKPYLQKSTESLKKQGETADKDQQDEHESEAVEHLRQALKIILSRPNKDNMILKLMDEVQSRLVVLNMYEASLMNLTISSLTVMKQESLPKSYIATHIFILENIMGQIRPQISDNGKYKEIMFKIKDADVEVPKKAVRMRRMRGMHRTISPSKIAESILKKAKLLK